MPSRLKNFDQMWEQYPAPGGSADEAKALIGGRALADTITNTCVLRISRSFNASGNPIPKDPSDEILTIKGADGKNYALRVREMLRYMKRKYGAPALTHRYEDQGGEVPPEFLGQQGVIIFEVEGWSDATGHIDLWNGSKCRHHGYFGRASQVSLWIVPETPELELSGSVGKSGQNNEQDVEIVQQLLADSGVDPGDIDGLSGSKTIAAIKTFQKRFLAHPDGRVDPDGRTWFELSGLS